MVKDIIKTVTFSCMLAGSMFVTCHVCAAGSVVNITGNVQDNTCDVDINSRNFDVSLGIYDSRQFTAAGDTTPASVFHVGLTSCGSAVSAVKLTFTGTPDNQEAGLIQINSVNGARGVGIQLLDKDKHELKINVPTTIALMPGTQTIAFYARLKATYLPVKAGNVDAVVNFVLDYQ